jgi:hypothetical protein
MAGFIKALAIGTAAVLLASAPAIAGPTFYFDAGQNYKGVGDSPFSQGGIASGGSFQVENFESGGFTLNDATINKGKLKAASSGTDSVLGDTGNVKTGHSWASGNSKSIVIKFTDASSIVNMAGLVVTDAKPNSKLVFKAWDAAGNLLGKIKYKLNGNAMSNGSSAGDRFFGLINEEGISKIKIQSNKAYFEIDHVQFGYGFAVMPVPAPLALGAVGLLGAAIMRRRFVHKRA